MVWMQPQQSQLCRSPQCHLLMLWRELNPCQYKQWQGLEHLWNIFEFIYFSSTSVSSLLMPNAIISQCSILIRQAQRVKLFSPSAEMQRDLGAFLQQQQPLRGSFFSTFFPVGKHNDGLGGPPVLLMKAGICNGGLVFIVQFYY